MSGWVTLDPPTDIQERFLPLPENSLTLPQNASLELEAGFQPTTDSLSGSFAILA